MKNHPAPPNDAKAAQFPGDRINKRKQLQKIAKGERDL